MLTPQLATSSDLDQITEMVRHISRWLKTKGIQQWSDSFPREILEAELERGELFVIRDREKVIGAVALSKKSDELWDDSHENTIYLHRLIIARDKAGQKLGETFMAWAEQESMRQGAIALRLVCDASNLFLSNYYEKLGYKHQGVKFFAPWKMNFATFEKKLA